MTKEEMIRSFNNVKHRCKQQCPYQRTCKNGDFCVLREAALIMASDAIRMKEMEQQIKTLRDLNYLQLDYARFMEERCYDYYDSIHDYNEGVIKKLNISPKRKMAMMRRKKTQKLKQYRDRTKMDGDPRYEKTFTVSKEAPEEMI